MENLTDTQPVGHRETVMTHTLVTTTVTTKVEQRSGSGLEALRSLMSFYKRHDWPMGHISIDEPNLTVTIAPRPWFPDEGTTILTYIDTPEAPDATPQP